ncbi:hypothetical protein HanIR_Chr02g0082931 [Helianthus annuus]|nr:hypothetical protein HanIR_Chr02g0082931 [Helianthus annuus]
MVFQKVMVVGTADIVGCRKSGGAGKTNRNPNLMAGSLPEMQSFKTECVYMYLISY